jgi:hypothetical protein
MVMNSQLAKEFRERWQAVAAVEILENRTTSLDVRWRQMNAVLNLAIGLRLSLTDTDRQEEIVRQRWIKLKSRPA